MVSVFILFTLLTQCVSEVELYGKIWRSHRERVLKQSDTITPPVNLRVGKSSKEQHYDRDRRRANKLRDPSRLRDIRQSEHDRDKQTDGRNIEVTIRHRLPANLNKSDNWDQRPDKPKQAYDEPWATFPLENTEGRNCNQ